jgi:hypothetical protein
VFYHPVTATMFGGASIVGRDLGTSSFQSYNNFLREFGTKQS